MGLSVSATVSQKGNYLESRSARIGLMVFPLTHRAITLPNSWGTTINLNVKRQVDGDSRMISTRRISLLQR